MIYLLISLVMSIVVVILLIFYIVKCFTYVNEGTAKNIVRFGGYVKTLLVKEDYKLDLKGDVVKLESGDITSSKFFGISIGGLRWVSLLKPLGIDKIYTRTMKYVKALPDGTFETRSDENTDFVLVAHYQYGLQFDAAEDSKKLPLSGKMTMTVMITNPYKALFKVKNWFDALVSRVLPRVRQYISEHTYDELINSPDVHLDVEVLKMLRAPDPGGGASIDSILKEQYGITLVALETVNIDPPAEYRNTTLKKWVAQQDAEVEAEESGGALTLMVERQIEAMSKHHTLTTEDKIVIRKECMNILLRNRAGKSGGLKDIRIANADGSSFATGSIASIVGAVAAAFASKESTGGGGSTGSSSERKGDKNQGGSFGENYTQEELEKELKRRGEEDK